MKMNEIYPQIKPTPPDSEINEIINKFVRDIRYQRKQIYSGIELMAFGIIIEGISLGVYIFGAVPNYLSVILFGFGILLIIAGALYRMNLVKFT